MENLHALLDVEGNIVTKKEEKAEVLNVFFASVFNSKTHPQGNQPSSWGTESRIDFLQYMMKYWAI